MSNNTDALREKVLREIAGGHAYQKIGKVTYSIAGKAFHIKVKKTGTLQKYPFNINKTVLSADFEVLICGTPDFYYVLQKELMRKMHDDPHAMEDSWNPGYTVYDIYPMQNSIVYGTGGISVDITQYRNAKLDPQGHVCWMC